MLLTQVAPGGGVDLPLPPTYITEVQTIANFVKIGFQPCFGIL